MKWQKWWMDWPSIMLSFRVYFDEAHKFMLCPKLGDGKIPRTSLAETTRTHTLPQLALQRLKNQKKREKEMYKITHTHIHTYICISSIELNSTCLNLNNVTYCDSVIFCTIDSSMVPGNSNFHFLTKNNNKIKIMEEERTLFLFLFLG